MHAIVSKIFKIANYHVIAMTLREGMQRNCFLANQLNTRKIKLFNMNGASFENSRQFTTKKLANIKRNIDRIFSLVNCSKFHQQNILSLYLLVNTDGNIPSICTKRITMEKKRIKKKEVRWHVFYTDGIIDGINTVGQIHPQTRW